MLSNQGLSCYEQDRPGFQLIYHFLVQEYTPEESNLRESPLTDRWELKKVPAPRQIACNLRSCTFTINQP